MAFNINQRLNGLEPLAYAGVNAVQPPDFVTKPRPPNSTDSKNFYLGTLWLDTTGYPNVLPTADSVWMLVALIGNQATWIQLGGGDIETLTGNTGGAVGPDGAFNINVVGDTTTITVAGNPGTNTLTISTVGTGVVNTLTGDAGGPVSPLAGNINTLGTAGQIVVTGNPGTHTLTWSLDASIATQYTEDVGVAVPVANNLNIIGAGGITTSGAADTVTIDGSGIITTNSFPTDSGTATPAAGVLNILAQNAALGCGSSVLFSAPGPANTVQLNVTDANSNTIVGNNAGNLTLTSTNSTGLGKSVLHALTSGNSNTVIGSLSGALITTSPSNTIVGEGSGTAIAGGSGLNTILGQGSGTGITTGSGNIILGQASGNSITTETNNICIGISGVAGASSHLFIGIPGAQRILHNYGGSNVFYGPIAGNFTLTTAEFNTGIGGSSLLSLTTGDDNTAVGDASLQLITTGTNNAAFGSDAGLTYTTESNNIILGSTHGTAAESNVMRLGNDGSVGGTTTAKTWIYGVRGVTTDVNDAIAVLIDSAGQLGTVSSSRKVKDNINDMGSYSDVLYSLRPVTFNYKHHSSESVSVGLIAEEVHEVAPQLVVHSKDGEVETVKYHDLVPMLLNELQKHCKLLAKRDIVIEELLNRVRILEEKLL